jgi:hypothetical protein
LRVERDFQRALTNLDPPALARSLCRIGKSGRDEDNEQYQYPDQRLGTSRL